MGQEYTRKAIVKSIDKTPISGGFSGRSFSVTPWFHVETMETAALQIMTSPTFSGINTLRMRTTSSVPALWITLWRCGPLTKEKYLNLETALGCGSWGSGQDISFVIGNISNAGVAQVLKFKILAWGLNASNIQIWNATTNAWVTVGTLAQVTGRNKEYITIKAKANMQTGFAEYLQIGALSFDLSAYALETEIGQVFNSGLATPGYNMGIFGVEYTNTTVPTVYDSYIDKIKTWGSST